MHTQYIIVTRALYSSTISVDRNDLNRHNAGRFRTCFMVYIAPFELLILVLFVLYIGNTSTWFPIALCGLTV